MGLLKLKRHCLWLLMLLTGNYSYGQDSMTILYNLSAKQFKSGRYDDALITNIKVLKIAEKNNNCPQTAYALLQVGRMEYYQSRKQALNTLFKCNKLLEACPVDSILQTVSINMGGIYTEMDKKDSALYYLKKSLVLLEKTTDYNNLSKVHAVLADLFMYNFNDMKQGERHLVKAEQYAAQSKNKVWIAFALMKRGIFYQKLKKYPEALSALKNALRNYEDLGLVEGRLYAIHKMLNVMFVNGHPETEKYFYILSNLKDSIYKVEGAAKIAEYRTIYETEKKETQNKLLQQENQLSQTEIESKNRTIIVLVIGVLLIIITASWRISVINLKKKNRELEATQALQKEKERISRDLHDNVGGQLSYVLYSLDGMNEENVQKRTELTSNINESIRNVIGNLRETIWAINEESITLQDFSDKLKVYARNMLRNTTTHLTFKEEITLNKDLNAITGLNLYRICQEIINNAFKHAKATELKVDISVHDHTIIQISDNGIGFNPEQKADGSFGLSNIKGRADEAGISLELKTGINEGTTYILSIK